MHVRKIPPYLAPGGLAPRPLRLPSGLRRRRRRRPLPFLRLGLYRISRGLRPLPPCPLQTPPPIPLLFLLLLPPLLTLLSPLLLLPLLLLLLLVVVFVLLLLLLYGCAALLPLLLPIRPRTYYADRVGGSNGDLCLLD